MSDKTVKINVNWESSSAGAAEEDVIDTGLTPEQWEALGEEGRDAHGGELLECWFNNAVQSGWSVVDDA